MSIEAARRVTDNWSVNCVRVYSVDLSVLSIVRNRCFSNANVNVLKRLDVIVSKWRLSGVKFLNYENSECLNVFL